MIKLGVRVKDTITDFCGTTTARCVYLNGCVQYEVTSPKLNDGKLVKVWLDEQQLVKVPEKKSDSSRSRAVRKTGGPQSTPTGQSHPSSSSS